MKKYLILLTSMFLLACSDNTEKEGHKITSEEEANPNKSVTEYTLIKDNLYSDDEGSLYLKSRTREHFETGKWIDVWIKTVYCDSCWTPTKDGWKDITELKDFVDINSFHLDTTYNGQGGDFYEDMNYRYFHKWMADGGTISLIEK